jgi:hypothetical protein
MYVAGSFIQVQWETRSGVVALDINSSGRVYSFFIDSQNIMLGGEFASVNGVTRKGFAEIDDERFRPTDWEPELSGPGAVVKKILHK